MRIFYSSKMPRKVYSLQDNEFDLPQHSIWEDGSWYRATWNFETDEVEREFGGPLFEQCESA